MRCLGTPGAPPGAKTGFFPPLFAAATLLLLAAFVGIRQPTCSAEPKPEAAAALALDQQLIAQARDGSHIMKNLTYLSDVIGPRLTGSANLRRANDWAADTMKAYGLTNVQLEGWELPVAWERGSASARIIEPDNGRSLSVAAMGWTPGTNGKVQGDVVVINARTPEELKAYQGKLKGAIVLRGPPATVRPITDLGPPVAPTPPLAWLNPFNAGGALPGAFDSRPNAEMLRFRREIAEFLRKEGVAVMLSDAGKPHGLLTMTGGWSGRDRASAADPLPTLFVAHEHYALLYRLATRPAAEPTPKTRLEVEITNKLIPGPHTVYNTVGEIRGSEKPDEYVVLGAHLDSWDLGQGTTDNGTGTCVVLETARILARSGVKPKRTIRFVLFTGEEQGLHGSRAYVQRHKDELLRTSAAVVHDTGTGRIVGLSLMGRDSLKPIMEAELAALKDLGVVDISTRSMSGSDHQSFEGAGVPGLMFRQDPAEYRLTHHSQSDTLDKAREPDLIQGAQVMAVLAARLANRDDLLPRDKRPVAGQAEGAKLKEEIDKLQGTWSFVSLEVEGLKLPAELFKGSQLVIKGDAFTMNSGGVVYKGTWKVDVNAKPKTLDLQFTEGPEKGKSSAGIYELDGDTWKICLGLAGKERPKEFVTKPGSGHALETLKREKP